MEGMLYTWGDWNDFKTRALKKFTNTTMETAAKYHGEFLSNNNITYMDIG
jgi:hypothetical protein